ncbi:MAG: glycoside hydrolase family 2 protein [Bacteroidetes bacterium]|nr:MAG: glycoside hydrolase family 2 protein [Bacteroidota bacterium]
MRNSRLFYVLAFIAVQIICGGLRLPGDQNVEGTGGSPARERVSINEGWRFMRYTGEPDKLIYDERPTVSDRNDNKVADTKPSEEVIATSSENVLKKWILPTANDFINDPAKHHQRPNGNPGSDFLFVQNNFNDNAWETVNLPHDWAIKGPFYKEANAIVGGGMGRLPVQGVGWYRRKLDIPSSDASKSIYLDIDGAMSYAMVWLNGNLVGGWPYGYNSFRLDLTPYIKPGGDNQLAIRIDNPANSSRWYPGAGIYRNVWLTKLNPVHVAQWGTFIRTRNVSAASATIDLIVQLENKSSANQAVTLVTEIYRLNDQLERAGKAGNFPNSALVVQTGEKSKAESSLTIKNPLLWGPRPSQRPNLYVAVTRLYSKGKIIDEYETRFGIRSVKFDPVKGVLVNDRAVRIQGVNQHHDLGALGAAFNKRAAERQLEILAEMGCNAIRMAHNPPAPELLDLTDRMGFLVIDEIFDCWERGKTPLDFHLIFPDWHEADTRTFIRRDRNHPSVIAWSFGNEVGEQYTADAGAALAKQLHDIVREEDDTRPATASMNYAKPEMPFPQVMDVISLNYQGEGIRDAPAYSQLKGIKTSPLYPAFQKQFPGKLIVSSETASALSTRGTYLFPVVDDISAPVSDSTGGDPQREYVSAYELYTAAFGASPDKVFASQDKHPYVAGEFVWSGWDYLGEPTPYYSARSSYCGIIDLAGFKKDRFYLYQSRWRSDFRMVHILPHWTWPERLGQVTPVHVFTSGDEVELFLNGRSLGKKKKAAFEYRLRWDDVKYEPGELKAVAYKNVQRWAEEKVMTTGKPAQLTLNADRYLISADGEDLSFIRATVTDEKGLAVPVATNSITFSVDGPGKIVATDNGDPADLLAFASKERTAYSGMALVIVRSEKGRAGDIKIIASSPGLKPSSVIIKNQPVLVH